MINSKPTTETLTLVSLIPEHKMSHEEYASSLNKLCQNVRERYEHLITAASDGPVSKKGIKAAKQIQKKYGLRLDELCAADFTVYSEDEISDYYSEISSIITALREADELIRQQ